MRGLILSVFLFAPLSSFLSPAGEAGGDPEDNFLKMERLYEQWNSGFFGSRKYYEGQLRNYLGFLIYKNFETPEDFAVISPEGLYDNRIHTKMRFRRWLEIRGEIDTDSAVEAGITPERVRTGWRSREMISAGGKVLKARPAYNVYGRSVELYLNRIIIKKKE